MVAYTTSRTLDFVSNIPLVGTVESAVVRIPWGVAKTAICAVGATYNKLETGSAGKWGEGFKDGLKTTGRGTIQLVPFVGSAFVFYQKPYKKRGHYEWHGVDDPECPFASYEGGWKDCKPQGHGTMHYKDGDVYVGYWEEGKKTRGKMINSVTDNVYDGEWNDSEKHGEGTQTYGNHPEKKVYKGGWKNNREDGQGKMTYQSGADYEGRWRCGNRCGTGTYSNDSEGISYQGEWSSNRKSGKGTYKCPQYSYEGHFCMGAIEGKGTMELLDGTKCTGEWERGLLVEGIFVEGEVTYKGKWRANNKLDSNPITLPTGRVVGRGSSLEQIFGNGTIRYSDKKIYEGDMLYGKPHGKGIMNFSDGREQKGRWEFGEFKTVLEDDLIDLFNE